MDTENSSQNSQINERFNQIRDSFFDGDNKLFAAKIGEKEQNLSSICTGSRSVGLATIMKLLRSIPDVDANWLLMGDGNMLKPRQSVGNITDSKVIGVNVNGSGIIINPDHSERIIQAIEKQQKQNELFLQHITKVINIIISNHEK